MRIVLVVHSFPAPSETFIISKAIGLFERGRDVHIVCRSSPQSEWDSFDPMHPVHRLRSNVHVVPSIGRNWGALTALSRLLRSVVVKIPRYVTSGLKTRLASRSSKQRIRSIIGHLPFELTLLGIAPDIVHFEFGALAPGGIPAVRRVGALSTVSFRGFDISYSGLDTPNFYQVVWDQASAVHVLGDGLWQRAVERGAPPGLEHFIIPPALDPEKYDPRPPREGRLGLDGTRVRVLSVGRLHWTKGYEYGLEALAILRRRGFEVEARIVGDGPLSDAVYAWRHQLGLDDVVQLVGRLPHQEIVEQLAWADVFLHSATSEGFCNAVLEAQASGLPVVTTDADGLPENIYNGVTGIVVPRRDPIALAQAIDDLAINSELRYRMSRCGPERVAAKFDIVHHLDAWERFFEEVG